jgi:hypothetical protein
MASVQVEIRTVHLRNVNKLEPNLFGYGPVVDDCYRAYVSGEWRGYAAVRNGCYRAYVTGEWPTY